MTEHLYSKFHGRWLDASSLQGRILIHPDRVLHMGGIYLPDAHNKMIQFALARHDHDGVLWIEHDHTFPPHIIQRVMSYPPDIDVAGLLYFGRSETNPWPMTGMWNPQPEHDSTAPNTLGECGICGRDTRRAGERHVAQPYGMRYLKPSELIPMLEDQGLYEVDFVPSGFTFIRRHVLENWPITMRPIYRTVEDTEDSAGAGDDVRFAKLCQEQGYKLHLDTWCPIAPDGSSMDVKHLTSFELGRDYWWDRIKFKHYENLAHLEKAG